MSMVTVPPVALKPRWTTPVELNLGDVVMYVGDMKYAILQRRVVYRVVDKEQQPENASYPFSYRFTAAFDLENPLGQVIEPSCQMSSLKDFRKLGLLDLGVIRLIFDDFIKEWAKKQSNIDIEHMPEKDDIVPPSL